MRTANGGQIRWVIVKRLGKFSAGYSLSILILGVALSACSALSKHPKDPPVLEEAAPVPIPLERPDRKPRNSNPDLMPGRNVESNGFTPDSLIGLEPAAVRDVLGQPTHIRNDELSREWVYVRGDCLFSVFFYPDINKGSFKALKYDQHNGLDDMRTQCLRHLLAERKNVSD